MRAFAIPILVATSLLWTSVTVAEDTDSANGRSAVEWLFDDLGVLFSRAAEALKQGADQDGRQAESKTTAVADPAPAETVAAETRPAPLETATADGHEPVPISALFDDILGLFQATETVATDIVEQTPAPESAQPPREAAAAIVVADSAETEAGTPSPESRNAIEWLLSDLANLFKPTLEIDQPGEAEEIAEPAPEPEPAPVPNITPIVDADASSVDAPEPIQADSAESRSAIEWLLDDLAALARPEAETTLETASDAPAVAPEPASPEPEIVAETVAAVEPAPAPAATEREPNVLDQLASFFKRDPNPESAPAQPSEFTVSATPSEDADVEVEAAAKLPSKTASVPEPESIEVEIGPWTLSETGDVFEPAAEAIERDTRVAVIELPRTEPEAASEESPRSVDAAPNETENAPKEIRRRQEPDPQARNHLALGKPELPAHEEPSVFQHFLDNLFLVDRTPEPLPASDSAEETAPATVSESDVQTERVANKISDRIVPEEKLDLGYTAPAPAVPEGQLDTIGEGPLLDIDLFLGDATVVNASYDIANFENEACMDRPLHVSVFCVTPLNWPAEIADSFAQDTSFLRPGEGLVRFENGDLSRAYAVFAANDFAGVVKFMQKQFGPPLEREIVWMHMIEAPRLPNTTFRWRAVTPDRRNTVVLEVRNFDDLRRSFADMDHGMVRLYREGSRPIFKHLSTMDLMLLQRRRVARAEVDVGEPPRQK